MKTPMINLQKCPFCQKSTQEYFMENQAFAAIYNIAPILPGHSLIIPKRHVESLFELSNEELSNFMKLGRDVAFLLSKVLDTDAFDWAIQEKEAAGQSVPHLHMHVVPRKIGDLKHPGDWYQEVEKSERIDDPRKRLTKLQLQEITEVLRKQANLLFP